MTRVVKGARMAEAIEVVASNPGCTKLTVARLVGPNRSLAFGYAIVDRAIKAGFIRAEWDGRKYALFVA